MRYLYPALPLATIFIASAFASAARRLLPALSGRYHTCRRPALPRPLLPPIVQLAVQGFRAEPAFQPRARRFVTAHTPERNLVAYFNRTHPGSPVAFFESSAIAGLRAPSITTTWHNIEFRNRMLECKTPPDCLSIVQDHGAHLVIAPVPGSGAYITTTPMEAFLKHCTVSELRSGNFLAGHLQGHCSTGWDQPGPVLPPGEFDDFDDRLLYTGLWFRGQFADASRGTLTYSNDPGATVVLRFNGTEVRYVYTKAFNRGIAEIRWTARAKAHSTCTRHRSPGNRQ